MPGNKALIGYRPARRADFRPPLRFLVTSWADFHPPLRFLVTSWADFRPPLRFLVTSWADFRPPLRFLVTSWADFRPPLLFLIVLNVLFFLCLPSTAQLILDNPDELKGIDVVERLGDTLRFESTLVDHNGDTVAFGRSFTGDRPVIMTLFYSDCPMLCSLVLNGLSSGLQAVSFTPGQDYRLLSLSIDPAESVERSRLTRERYQSGLTEDATEDAWTFFTADSSTIAVIADALGFKFYKDEETGQFAHPAVVLVLTPDGVISRYLYGIDFKPQDLKMALLEAGQGRIGNTIDRILLYCFHYDPDSKGYTLFASNLMRLGGVAVVILLGGGLGILWWRESVRNKQV